MEGPRDGDASERKELARERRETSRVEALSDGIFAIAMTLLVIDLRVPLVGGDASLVKALLDEWPAFLAFLIGFVTLLICWVNHHYMFELIRRSNGILLVLNGFKMLVVAFTPFVTAMLARYIGTDQASTAVTLYLLNFLVMGVSMTCLWCYAASRGLASASSPTALMWTTRLYILATVMPLLLLLLSLVSTGGSLVAMFIMFGFFVFPRGIVARLAHQEP